VKVLITGVAGFIACMLPAFAGTGCRGGRHRHLNDYYDVQLKEDRLKQLMPLSVSASSSWTWLSALQWKRFSPRRNFAGRHLAAQPGVRYSLQNPMPTSTPTS